MTKTKQYLIKVNIWCQKHQTTFATVFAAVLTTLAIIRLGYEYWRLILRSRTPGDLGIFYSWIHTWFTGGNMYQEGLVPVLYPPASYILLWPLFGWLSIERERWFFATITTLSLVWLIQLVLRETGITSKSRRFLTVLFILAIYPTGITIGNGQLILCVLPALLCGILILYREEQSWRRDIFASLFLLFALVKPPVSAPFFLVVLLAKRTYRVLFIVVLCYVALTAFALSFQDVGFSYFRVMGENAAQLAAKGGYGNIHIALSNIGLQDWRFSASIAMVTLLAVWLYFNRDSDIWLLLAVTAIVARVWTYHRLYDDLLILLPMITLFRISRDNNLSITTNTLSGILLFLLSMSLLAPGTLLRLETPLGTLCRAGQVLLWVLTISFLITLPRTCAKYSTITL